MQRMNSVKRILGTGTLSSICMLLITVTTATAIIFGAATSLITGHYEMIWDQNKGEWVNSFELGSGNSNYPSVSESGQVMAFSTKAEDLGDDGNGFEDIYLYDERIAYVDNQILPISQNPLTGELSNGDSRFPSINREPGLNNSNDGRYIVFQSNATNLATEPGELADTNNQTDIYLYQSEIDYQNNRVNPSIHRVSLSNDGQEANGPSGSDGSASPTSPLHPGAAVYYDSMDDTPVVVFESAATNLVSGDTNGKRDLFLRFMDLGNDPPAPTTTLLTRIDGNPTGALSNGDSTHPVVIANPDCPNCQFVVFVSTATNLVTGVTPPSGVTQIYLLDTYRNRMYLVSRYNGSSTAGNNESRFPSIAVNTTTHQVTVAFHSLASNLVDNDTNGFADVFAFTMDFDGSNKTMERVSVNSDGVQGNMHSFTPALGYGGRLVTFTSYSSNLVSDDSNYKCRITFGGQLYTNCADIFVYDRATRQVWRSSLNKVGQQADYNSSFPTISGNGRYTFFSTYTDFRSPGTPSTYLQIYRRDQGMFVGNPILKPSSWDIQATIGQPEQMTFEIDFTENYPEGKMLGTISIDRENDPNNSFSIIEDNCSNTYHPKDDSCTFTVQFAADNLADYKTATLLIPLPDIDVRGYIYAALKGRSVYFNYVPLIP